MSRYNVKIERLIDIDLGIFLAAIWGKYFYFGFSYKGNRVLGAGEGVRVDYDTQLIEPIPVVNNPYFFDYMKLDVTRIVLTGEGGISAFDKYGAYCSLSLGYDGWLNSAIDYDAEKIFVAGEPYSYFIEKFLLLKKSDTNRYIDPIYKPEMVEFIDYNPFDGTEIRCPLVLVTESLNEKGREDLYKDLKIEDIKQIIRSITVVKNAMCATSLPFGLAIGADVERYTGDGSIKPLYIFVNKDQIENYRKNYKLGEAIKEISPFYVQELNYYNGWLLVSEFNRGYAIRVSDGKIVEFRYGGIVLKQSLRDEREFWFGNAGKGILVVRYDKERDTWEEMVELSEEINQAIDEQVGTRYISSLVPIDYGEVLVGTENKGCFVLWVYE